MSKRILNQSSKSTSSKKIRRLRDISPGLPHSEFPAATSTFSGLVVAFIISLLSISTVSAASISVSVSGEMNLDLLASDEGMFGTSTPTTISVVSSNTSGYTLTLTGDRTDGKLVGTNPDHYFTNITGPLTEVEFNTSANNGKWGILPSKYNSTVNTSYQKAPTSNESATIDTTATANYSPNTYTLAVAARASTSAGSMTLADEYTGTFTLAATGNAIDYDIAYADANDNMPGLTYGASSTGTATVSSNTPTREGYNFGGWCTVSVTIGESCTSKGGTVIASGGDYTLSSGDNNVTLYAIWNPITFAEAFGSTAMTMQNMTTSICNAVTIGQEATLTDTRENGSKSYKVGKLKDGHCWMLDNLALGRVALTPNDTNISSNYTFPTNVTTWSDSFTEAKINTGSINTIPTDAMSTAGGWKVGIYYNYCAATAGTYCPSSDTVGEPVKQDICPKGWRIPSGGNGGEYQTLFGSYINDYTNFRTAMHLPLSGYYRDNQTIRLGDFGSWWAGTFHSIASMYRLRADSDSVNYYASEGRPNGFPLRCIAK